MVFNATVNCSSRIPDRYTMGANRSIDTTIRKGIVRRVIVQKDITTYQVDVEHEGKIVPVACTLMKRFGGAHNFEEQTLRPWLATAGGALGPGANGLHAARAGDIVVVGMLAGNSREGIIIGCMDHPSRKPKLKNNKVEFISEFNGLETSIINNGSYKVTFKGYAPTNEITLKLPPSGKPILPPVYNPLYGGSYYGFSKTGSYIASDGKQFLKIHKNLVSGSIILKSGTSQIELGGNPVLGNFSVKSGKAVMDFTTTASIKAKLGIKLEALQVSIKGTQIAVGTSQFEIFKGLSDLIDALGNLIVTSPVGTCTPLMAAPTWLTAVVPLQLKLKLATGSLKAGDAFALKGDDSPTIEGVS